MIRWFIKSVNILTNSESEEYRDEDIIDYYTLPAYKNQSKIEQTYAVHYFAKEWTKIMMSV